MAKQQQSSDLLTMWHNDLGSGGLYRGKSGNWAELSHIMVVDQSVGKRNNYQKNNVGTSMERKM